MFKNAIVYRINGMSPNVGFNAVEEALQANSFVECAATQEKSTGWVPPRGNAHDPLLEVIGGQWILKLMTEIKRVPAGPLKEAVEKQCAEIEAQTGRKPGKKERRELADEARLSMLPMAFPMKSSTTVWIDVENNLLWVDAGSQGKVDEVITQLIKSIDGLSLQMINTNTSPAASMAAWLATKEAPFNFSVDRECELKACDESKAVVKYGRHALDTDEVVQHIAQGKMPTKLALTWNDRVSFVLADTLQLKKIAIQDVAMDGQLDREQDAFDADVAILTGELSSLLPDLIEALGGEVVRGEA
jgi:recombination associated protein RdgC